MDAVAWDARYSASDLVWGTAPNQFVAAELAQSKPGRALDVACGEGRNAIWLASRGWFTVGVDFSSVAIDRARQLARQAGVSHRTRFEIGDAVAGDLPDETFDAVVVAYLQLPAPDRARALGHAAARVAPGGVLVVVGHDSSNLTDGVGGPQNPLVLYSPDDIAGDLGEELSVVKAERVHRTVATDDGECTAIDALVVATRRA